MHLVIYSVPPPHHLHPIYSLFLIQLTSAVYPGRLRAYNDRIESIDTNYRTAHHYSE